MACERRSSGKRRLLRWPRLPETRPAGPRSSKAAHSRRTWRSDRPMNSPAFACVSRPSMTRRTTSRRSSSFLLIATSSVPIHPAPWRHRAAETGHLYLGGTGHFHLAATSKERISAVPSPPPSSLIPSSATRTRRGGATPRRAGDKPHPALQSAGSLSAICNAGLSIIYGLTTVRAALNRPRMRTLIAGIGALGGTIATRAVSAGVPVWLATRTAESARALRSSGLRVSGIGGAAVASGIQVAALEEYRGESFDLIVLATKAHDALESAPFLSSLLSPGGTLLCIQNGGVSQILSARLGSSVVLGGLSNLGATMVEPGIYEQRNAGHLLIGELASGLSERAANVARTLSPAIETRVTANMRSAVWAKLLLNCSVTTLGAIAARTMRQYIASSTGKEVFRRTYDEALSVALASGTRPERMIVEPIPGEDYGAWIEQVIAGYGDVKPSMLQDFEKGRRTEIDFINGYVAQMGEEIGVPVPMNAAMTELVHRIEQGQLQPAPARLDELSLS